MLQRVAAYCSMMRCSVLQGDAGTLTTLDNMINLLQCVAVCCSVLRGVAASYGVLQYDAACCSML